MPDESHEQEPEVDREIRRWLPIRRILTTVPGLRAGSVVPVPESLTGIVTTFIRAYHVFCEDNEASREWFKPRGYWCLATDDDCDGHPDIFIIDFIPPANIPVTSVDIGFAMREHGAEKITEVYFEGEYLGDQPHITVRGHNDLLYFQLHLYTEHFDI